jgi:hypothetical protein
MIDRGMESFVDAVKACQEKRVKAVIVRDVLASGGGENDLIVMGSSHKDGSITIPSVFVSRKTGDELDALIATNPAVFVELFAADDVNSLMAYVAYLVMSAETLFFLFVLSMVLLVVGTRRMFRSRSSNSTGRRCRLCKGKDDQEHRAALLVNNRGLFEPLHPSSSTNTSRVTSSEDLEGKLRSDNRIQVSYPVVYAQDSTTANHQQQSLPVHTVNDDPVFDQQEQ